MSEEIKRPVFEPPLVRDLSAFSASGGKPQGQCVAGPLPFFNCVTGTAHPASDCTAGVGGDSSACNPGGFHETPACNFGGNAATICISGSAQQ